MRSRQQDGGSKTLSYQTRPDENNPARSLLTASASLRQLAWATSPRVIHLSNRRRFAGVSNLHTGVSRRGSFSFEQAFGEMFDPTAASQRNGG